MNYRMLIMGLAASIAVVPACVLAQHALQGGIPAPKVRAISASALPFNLYRGNRVIVDAKVNGRPLEALLDTGASMTTLDRTYARLIGLGPGHKIEGHGTGGTVEAELVSGVTLEIGGMRFEDMTVGVMDLQPVAKQIGRPLPIIVGRELFNNAAISFDWAGKRLTIVPSAEFKAPADAVVVPVERRGPFNFVKVSAAGLPAIDALLDLGNSGALILPSDYWLKQPVLAALPFADGQGGGVGGSHTTRSVTIPSVQFAGRTFERVPAALGPDSQSGHAARDANVGIGMLKQFDLTLDVGRDRIFVKPRPAPVDFERDRAGLRTQLAGDRLKVTFVSPQGPAAATGIRAGDEIVAVNGQPIAADYYQRPEWSRGPAGTAVALKRVDGSEVQLTLRDFY